MDGLDVGVVEFRKRFSLLAEALAGGLVSQRAFGKDFDGNVSAQMLIAGALDHPHAPAADLFDDAVVPERLANHGNEFCYAGNLRARRQASQRCGLGAAPCVPVRNRDGSKE